MRKKCKRAVCVLMLLPFFAVLSLGLVACKGEARPSYALTLEYVPAAGILYGEMQLAAVGLSEEPQTELKLSLFPNAFREGNTPVPEAYRSAVYYEGESFGHIDVRELKGAGSFSLSEDGATLTAVLPRALKRGEHAALSMQFEVMLPRINYCLGIGEHTVNLLHFYPLWLMGEAVPYADYAVSLTVPNSYNIICGFSGETHEENARTTFTMTAESVREVCFVLAEGMTCTAGERARYWHLRRDASEELAVAEESLTFFSETFGEYDFPNFAVVETDLPFPFHGAGLALVPSLQAGEGLRESVVRTAASQWWGEMAGASALHPWQNAGLANWSAALYFETQEEGAYRTRVAAAEGRYRAFVSVRKQLSGEVDTSMDRPLSAFSGAYEYRSVIEDKSLILFDRIESVLGEKRMTAGIKQYFSAARGRIASPEELISSLSSKVDVSGIFASFVEGTCVI